ncbi:MAG: GSCFA domain-containing protein [Bacteroidales bacterium]|nr:GSCFA domain-containing protein [Candidatus Cryptobacteroides aphodequi]
MIKLTTEVSVPECGISVKVGDRILLLGSCFSDEIGRRMQDGGFGVCRNPFGTLYNPLSVLSALRRLAGGKPFGEDDCVRMGAGANLVCSFEHHTSFARKDAAEFLENANAEFAQAVAFWKNCNKVIITLGTACVWERETAPREWRAVSNCLKRPAAEFRHRMLGIDECAAAIEAIIAECGQRDIIFTVSPIRHPGENGAHGNQLSKATLLLALDKVLARHREHCAYFPAYEILLDELRDYRFYAEDLLHPSSTAEDIIWERFIAAFDRAEAELIAENEKAARRLAHRPIH